MPEINSNEFSVYLPILKLDEEKRMVWGYASTPSKDLQGEIVPLEAIKAALPAYMQWANIREMHTSSAVGITKEANVDETGLYIGAKIVDEAAWQKCKEQVYKGFSIGGNKVRKVGDTIKELQLLEISIVDRPANPDCRIDVIKVASAEPLVAPEGEGLAKMLGGWLEMGKNLLDKLGKGGDGLSKPADAAVATEAAQEGHQNVVVPAGEKTETEGDAEDGFDKTVFTQEERTRLAGTGAALPDGSFPIRNKEDLEHAIQAIGRAKDEAKAKAHIKSRADALGATSLLPDDWKEGSKGEKAAMTTEEQALAKRYSDAQKSILTKAASHLRKAEELREKCMKSLAKCSEMGKAAKGEDIAEHLSEMDKFLKAMGDHHDMAEHNMGKALGGSNGTVLGGGEREGVSLASEEKAGEGVDMFATNSPYSASALATMVKSAVTEATQAAVKPLEEKLAKAAEENSYMKGQLDTMSKMPLGGVTKPRLFGIDKSMAMPAGMGNDDGTTEVNSEINKAFNSIDGDDPDTAIRASARIIGLRAANPAMFGKSLHDPSFKGGAGR